ncbi:sugar-phosphate isomerase, RpiB/LacA/LacB family [Saccharomonospora marina XMU15]|uniref:D-erythrulose 4-phosphate isomerase n=1 Tax=Saccharomonospora marina XMU15 TaxID=882083 RepID=H5WZF8_9PSEU|nr:RpiB/LacA/LacB family sugar-phosphate isomerase [Saccharomonospora marina]EHR49620.1 sugar-phosphate isomerase, RpiB/LacA/LacB family [Saccharomonospora marina XMU15]
MSADRWRVGVGADDAGLEYKNAILSDLRADARVEFVEDFGVRSGEKTPYPRIGLAVAEAVAAGRLDRGVLICGTGIGMAISANKVGGVRATTVHDSYSCERSVLSNDCQIITFGQRVVGLELARRLVREWLGYVFDPSSPSRDKVGVISDYERRTGAPRMETRR